LDTDYREQPMQLPWKGQDNAVQKQGVKLEESLQEIN